MCVIIYNPPSVLLDKGTIEKCARTNDDGMGMVIATGGILHVHKELKDVDSFYNYYKRTREMFPLDKIVLHFRMSTQGSISLDNAHPFLVNDNLAFVHNGVVSGMGYDGTKSDTVIFNEKVLKKLPPDFYKNKTTMRLLAKFTGSNKFVYLDSEGHHAIVNEKAGDWDTDKNWFSNTYWRNSYRGYGYATGNAYGSDYNYGSYRQSADANDRSYQPIGYKSPNQSKYVQGEDGIYRYTETQAKADVEREAEQKKKSSHSNTDFDFRNFNY